MFVQDSARPDLSVIIAVYNGADTIGDQLAALARQSCTWSWEVLVCDNGCTDRTPDVVRGFADRLPGLRIVDARGRRGPGPARNIGALEARADRLLFCDADDVVADGWLQVMGDALASHRFVAGSFGTRLLNDDWMLRARPLQQQDGLQHADTAPYLPHAGAGNMGVDREAFLAVGGFDPEITTLEDSDLCFRLQLAGTPLEFVPAAVVHVRGRSTLPSLFRQGRAYGAAAAQLRRRYAGLGRPAPPAAASSGGGGRLGRVLGLLRVHDKGSLGHTLWQLGWHVGNRSGGRPVGPPLIASGEPSRDRS